MSRILSLAALCVLGLATQPAYSETGSPALGMMALDDGSLAAVSGREGIAVDLELRVNTDSAGAPLSSLSYCYGNNNPCRLAFQFHNRGSGGGEWIVWKDFFGTMKINNLWIDAGQTPSSGSGYQDTVANNRFMGGALGTTCLLDSSKTAATCHEAARNKPMLAQRFNNGAAGGIQLFMNLGRVATEYGTTGYNSDFRGSSLGVLIGDTSSRYAPAQMKIGGKVGLYGF